MTPGTAGPPPLPRPLRVYHQLGNPDFASANVAVVSAAGAGNMTAASTRHKTRSLSAAV